MSIELAPKKNRKPIDVVHNSTNASPSEVKRILNTTAEDANANYYFNYLIENFGSIKAMWEQKMEEAHTGKVLIPIEENANELKSFVDFLKTKGGNVDVKPDLSFETLNVAVTAIFSEKLSLNFKETETLSDIIEATTNFYMEALPKDVGIRIYFVYNDIGKYVDSSEVNQ